MLFAAVHESERVMALCIPLIGARPQIPNKNPGDLRDGTNVTFSVIVHGTDRNIRGLSDCPPDLCLCRRRPMMFVPALSAARTGTIARSAQQVWLGMAIPRARGDEPTWTQTFTTPEVRWCDLQRYSARPSAYNFTKRSPISQMRLTQG
jgi:hypothetical protein